MVFQPEIGREFQPETGPGLEESSKRVMVGAHFGRPDWEPESLIVRRSRPFRVRIVARVDVA